MTTRRDTERGLAIALHKMVAASSELAHRYAAAGEIGATDFAALIHLWEAGEERLTASALAAKLGVTPAAVTYIVDRLAERGYVERSVNPADRRQTLLTVRDTGGQVAHGYLNPEEWFSEALAAHSDAELASFTQMLAELTAALAAFAPEGKGDRHV